MFQSGSAYECALMRVPAYARVRACAHSVPSRRMGVFTCACGRLCVCVVECFTHDKGGFRDTTTYRKRVGTCDGTSNCENLWTDTLSNGFVVEM